jgi:lipopolysaccharide transport system permease protein
MMPRPHGWRARTAGAAATVALSWRIFARTIGAKYRKSFLGYFWMIAPALLITGVAVLANRAGVVTPGATELPYWLWVFFGTLLWQVFADAVEVPHEAFESARSYLTRVAFPREAIVLAQLYESLITTGARLCLALLVLAAVQGVGIAGAGVVALCFLGTVLLGLGLGAVLMPFTQLFADLQSTKKLLLGYGLLLTPAVYRPQGDGLFAALVRLNPMAPLMDAAREGAAGVAVAQPLLLAAVLLAGGLATAGGLLLVRAVAPIVVERMLLGGR